MGIKSNPKSKGANLPESSQNNKVSRPEPESLLDAETCRELFDTPARWNEYLENHVPYFQNQTQEQTP
ncbi:hypothetical protein [Nitrosomonas sp. Nm51]|uniref:hypothetical protein n=1 Tax=Nitrosomonas sp. Nm51 TaxID=133720 RepID=UPI001C430704|nr:hypothetical protein [Nitrosomonas sp. Nm51]